MGDESGWCTCRPKFGPSGGFDITGCPVHGHREREQYERDEEHWQATVGDAPEAGGRTDDHEYRGSHHQTPGTLQGGRTDAQSEVELLRRVVASAMCGEWAIGEGLAALDRLEARLVAAEEREEQALKGAMAWESAAAKAAERLDAVLDALRLVQQAATPPTGPVAAIAYDPLTHIRHIVSEALAPADTGQGIAEEERCSTCGATPETGISSDCPECYGIYPKKNAAGGSGS